MARSGTRIVVGATLAVLMASAVYLYAVRGSALLLDLESMTRGIFCF